MFTVLRWAALVAMSATRPGWVARGASPPDRRRMAKFALTACTFLVLVASRVSDIGRHRTPGTLGTAV